MSSGSPRRRTAWPPWSTRNGSLLTVARVAELVLVVQERAQHAEAHVDPAGREQARRVAVARGGHERQGGGVRVDRRGVVKGRGVGPAHSRGRRTVAGQVGGVRRQRRPRGPGQQARQEAADEGCARDTHEQMYGPVTRFQQTIILRVRLPLVVVLVVSLAGAGVRARPAGPATR